MLDDVTETPRRGIPSGLGDRYAGLVEAAATAYARSLGVRCFEPLRDDEAGMRERDTFRGLARLMLDAAEVRHLLYQREALSEENALMTEFQNGLTRHIPEHYEASEGSQESIIGDWARDVAAIAEAAREVRDECSMETGARGRLLFAVDKVYPPDEEN